MRRHNNPSVLDENGEPYLQMFSVATGVSWGISDDSRGTALNFEYSRILGERWAVTVGFNPSKSRPDPTDERSVESMSVFAGGGYSPLVGDFGSVAVGAGFEQVFLDNDNPRNNLSDVSEPAVAVGYAYSTPSCGRYSLTLTHSYQFDINSESWTTNLDLAFDIGFR